MAKVKNWRLALVVILAAFLFGTLAVAFINFPLGRAGAEDIGVLPGNTAEYTFVNDEQYPWQYEKATNTWTSTNKGISSSKPELTLTVTQDGDIAFEYLASAEKDWDYLSISKNDEEILGKDDETTSGDNKEFTSYTIKSVKTGDTIVFKYIKDSAGDRFSDQVNIKGLNLPTSMGSVTVNVLTDGHGKFIYETVEKDSMTQEIDFGGVLSVVAKADAEYIFAYWEDINGDIITFDKNLNLLINSPNTYTAIFHKNGELKQTISKIGDSDTWKKNGDCYEADMTVINNTTGTMSYAFDAGGYICFDSKVSVGTYEYLYVYLDGIEVFHDYSHNVDHKTESDVPWTHTVLQLESEGFHLLQFVYDDKGTVSDGTDGNMNIVYLKDIKTPATDEEAKLVDYQVDFDDKLVDVYVKCANNTPKYNDFFTNEVKLEPNTTYQIASDCKIFFLEVPKKNYESSIDATQMTRSSYLGFYTAEAEKLSNYGVDGSEEDDEVYYMSALFNAEGVTFSGNVKSTSRYLEVKVKEKAVAPSSVTVTPTIDGALQSMDSLNAGKTETTFNIPYGCENQFVIAISDYDEYEEELSIQNNGKTVQYIHEAGQYGFTLQDLEKDAYVTISIAGNFYPSDPYVINIKLELPEGTDVQQGLDPLGEVSVSTELVKPWVFSSIYSDGDNHAYVAGNSGYDNGDGNSEIVFNVKGGGTLAFNFYLAGYKEYSIAGFDFDKSVGEASYGGKLQSGQILAVGQCGKEYVESTLGPNYVTSLKDTLGSGWFHAEIPVNKSTVGKEVGDETEIAIHVAYCKWMRSSSYKDDVMAIRNVMYIQGESHVNYKVAEGGRGTITAKKAGESVVSGATVKMGDNLDLSIVPDEGYSFYAWRNVATGEYISFEKETTIIVVDDVNVEAVVATSQTYQARIGEQFYTDLQTALNAASQGEDKNVIVVDNININDDIIIGAGVNLIIPFNGSGDYYAEGTAKTATKRVSWSSEQLEKRFLYYSVTFGGNVTVNGNLYVGGVIHFPDQSAQAHTSGAYSQLTINGDVTVNGVMDVCGRVLGSGTITVKNNGKLVQPFMILDYNGGTNTQATFGVGVTPFKMYAMVNVQNSGGYIIEHGGVLYGHASLYFWEHVETIDQPFVTYYGGSDDLSTALLILHDGAKVKFVYNDGHARVDMSGDDPKNKKEYNTQDVGLTTLTINGDVDAGYMQFPLGVNTRVVSFSLPYNFELIINTGTFTVANDFKVMPGASVMIKEGAKVVVNKMTKLHFYDSFYGPDVALRAYPTSEQLINAQYKPYASFIVDGTLELMDQSSFVGTVQTNGTGTITIHDNVSLREELFDGVSTQYSCNYTEYTLVARVWDSAHNKMVELKSGENGIAATYQGVGGVTFTLPGITFKYETNTAGFKPSDEKPKHEHSFGELTTPEAEGLLGSWQVEHEPHSQLDWTLTPEEIPTDGNKLVHVTRRCDGYLCHYFEEKYLLFDGTRLDAGEYTGVAFDEAAIKALFEKLFGQIEGVSFNFDPFTEVGEHIVTINLPENYYWCSSDGQTLVSQKEITVDVQKRKVTLHISEQGKVYDGAEAALSAEQDVAFTIVDGSFAATLPGLAFEFTVDGEHINVADYAYTVSYTDTKNYDITFDNGASHEYKITAREITVNVLDGEKVYDGTDAKLEGQGWTLESGDIAEQASPDIVLTIQNAAAAAGEYQITAQYNNANYTVHFNYTADGHSTYTVNEREITVTIKNVTRDYNGEIASVGSVKDSDYTVEGDLCSVAPGITLKVENAAKDATTYHIVGEWSNKNYAVTFKGENSEETYATYQITPFALTLTFKKALGKVYDGETVTNITVTEEEFYDLSQKVFDRDDLQISLTVQNAKNQGSYNVVCIANNGNYAVTFKGVNGEETVSYVISKRALTVRADSFSSAYGDELQDWNVFHVDGAVESERDAIEALVSVACDVQKDGELRAYDIVVSVREDAILDNYTLSKTNGTYTLTSAQWKGVTFANVTCKYDGNAHKLEVAGIPDGSTVTYSYKEQQQNKPFEFTDAETYNVSVSVTHEGYSEAFTAQATLTIEKIKGTITVKNKSKIYDGDIVTVGSVKDVDWTFAGATDGDTLVEADIAGLISLSIQDPAADARAYNITAKVNNDNYELQVKGETDANNGIYTVDKREITVTIKNVTRDYNGEIASVGGAQDSDYTVEGDLCSVAPGITLKVEQAAKDAKTYHIVGEWSNKNYAVTFKGENSEQTYAVYTINKAQITVTLVKQGKIYDGVAIGKTLSLAKGTGYTMDKDPFAGDNLKLSFMLDADKTDVGEYDITCDYDNDNYAVKFEGDKVYAITSREITVTIKNVARDYNGEIASVGSVKDNDYTVEGDLCSVVPGITLKVEQAAKDATTYHIVGEWSNKNYAVTFKGENSEQTYAVYTINKAQITVTIKNVTRPYNGQIASVGSVKDTDYTIVGNVAQNDELNIVLNVEQAAMNVATYHIAGEWSNANYEVTFKGEGSNNDYATYEITPRDVSAMISLKVAGADVNKEPFETAYTGQDILVRASLTDGAKIGEDIVDVEIKIDGAVGSTLRNIKTYSVVVTVVGNADYTGTKTFSVNVAHVKGYTQHIVDILDRVFAVDITGIDADNFEATDEVYMKLKTIAQAAAELSTEELQALDEADEAKLASYTAIAEAWDSAIENAQSVIELAKKVADAPIKGLFQLAMEISALLALAFVGGKRI